VKPFSKEDFEALWRGVLPRHYTEPVELEDEGAGFDVVAAQARVFEALEESAMVSTQAYFLRSHSTAVGPSAASGRKASGTVLLGRIAPALGAITISAGRFLIAEQLDSFGKPLLLGRYALTETVTLPEGSGNLEAPVEAEFEGYTGDLRFPGQIVRFEALGRLAVPSRLTAVGAALRNATPTEAGRFDAFEDSLVGRYVRIVPSLDPLVSSLVSVLPRRVTGTFEGIDGYGQLVRGVYFDPPLEVGDVGKRLTVEVEELEDFGVVVTQPEPITGGRDDVLAAIAADRRQGRIAGETDEQFATRLQELPDIVSPAAMERIIDAILGPIGVPWRFLEISENETLMGFVWDLHPWDFGDLSPIPPVTGSELVGQGIVWLDRFRRFFLVLVGRRMIGDTGMFFDDTDPPAPNFWDVGFYDGGPAGFDGAIARLWNELNQAREAGIAFLIIIDPTL
jgi:hypothetical protein